MTGRQVHALRKERGGFRIDIYVMRRSKRETEGDLGGAVRSGRFTMACVTVKLGVFIDMGGLLIPWIKGLFFCNCFKKCVNIHDNYGIEHYHPLLREART